MPLRTLSPIILLVVLAVFATPSWPEERRELQLTADVLETDIKTGDTVAKQNARVKFEEWTLLADEIRVNRKSGLVRATGHVIATRTGLRILARSASYKQETGWLEVEGFRFGRPPYYAEGERGFGTAEEMTFENVELFYGEPGKLTPRARVRLLKVDRKRQLLDAKGLKLSIGSIPVLTLSGLVRPLTGPRLIWETRAGYDNKLGLQLGAGVYYPLSNGINPGGSFDVFTNRGILFGPGVRYRFNENKRSMDGAADLLYIHDGGERGVDQLGQPIDADRYLAIWKHQQSDGEHWTINSELNVWSDSSVLRDFRKSDFDRDQEPDNQLEASWYGSNYILSAFTRYRPNDFQVVTERLPEFRFDLLPTPLGATGALLHLESSAAALREQSLVGNDALRSDRFDVYAGLSRTISPAKGIAVTPVAGGRFTHYTRAESGRDNYTRWLGEVGFDAHLRAARTMELKKPLWHIDGLRHVVEPTLQYRYVPSADRGRAYIPEIDRPAFLTQLQPLGLEGRRDIDALEGIHTVRLGLNNVLQTRHEDYGSRQVATFDLASDIYLSDRPQGKDTSDVQVEMRLTPADWLDMWFFSRIDPGDGSVDEFNSRVKLADGEAWSVVFDNDFLKHDIGQFGLFGRYRLNEAYQLGGGIRYDARANRFNEIAVELDSQIAQYWLLQTGVVFRDGPRRESSFSIRVNLQFLAF